MKILFFDIETTGKADFKATYDAKHQPNIVQLGALLCDHLAQDIASLDLIIKPDGWTIPQDVAAIHGITDAIAQDCGVPILSALSPFSGLVKRADLIVAHNIAFDLLLCRTAYHRIGKPNPFSAEGDSKSVYCTMQHSAPVCKLPGGRFGYKWPSLAEAHEILNGQGFDKAHTAMAYVQACKRIYFRLNPPPTVVAA